MKMDPVVHFEMPYDDAKRVADFYSKTFGWGMNQLGEKMGNYMLAGTTESDEKGPKKPGAINGGFYKRTSDPAMQLTTVVISVDNLEESMREVKEAGGEVAGEPMDIPGIGKYVAIKDTEGNRVGMLEPNPMQ